jgi:Tfp pilus assembly protein PilE
MRRLREEEGFTVVAAMIVGIIVLGMGMALLAGVNVQSRQSGVERAKEAAFVVSESALNNTSQQLTRSWPTTTGTAYPTCTQASVPSATCTGNSLTPNYTNTNSGAPRGGVDFNSSPTYTVQVIDDLDGPNYYNESLLTRGACACDLSGATGTPDGFVWVRATSNVNGHTSVVVQLVGKGATKQVSLPLNAITAGWFATTNNGKKVIVDAKGSSAVAGNVAVRCATAAPSSSNNCLKYDPSKGQLVPASAWKASYQDGSGPPNATNRSSLDSATLLTLKQRAQSLGTYYATGCPPSLTGQLIYVENANCSYSTGTGNTQSNTGVVIFGSGTLTLAGNFVYYGLVYMANGQGTAPASGVCTSAYQNTVVTTSGTSFIKGSLFIDKCGGYAAGSSGLNFQYDSGVFAKLVTDGAVGTIKNSFRIISSS